MPIKKAMAVPVVVKTQPYLNLNSLCARRHTRPGLLSSTLAGVSLRGVPRIPACTVPFSLLYPPPGCFWAATFPLSFGSPSQGYSTLVCWFLPQLMADPFPSPSPHSVTDLLCSCHLQTCFVGDVPLPSDFEDSPETLGSGRRQVSLPLPWSVSMSCIDIVVLTRPSS